MVSTEILYSINKNQLYLLIQLQEDKYWFQNKLFYNA